MKGNIKKIIIVVILLLTGVLAVFGLRAARTYLSGAAGGAEPQNVQVQAEAKEAVISWTTEKETQSTVEYGTTPASLLLRAPEQQSTTSHKIDLSPLRAGTTYYFRIRVGDKIYDNDGIPFSFKTKAEEGETALPTEPPMEPEEPATSSAEPSTETEVKVSQCIMSEFMDKFGTSDASYDFDDNGLVNTRDWILCQQEND